MSKRSQQKKRRRAKREERHTNKGAGAISSEGLFVKIHSMQLSSLAKARFMGLRLVEPEESGLAPSVIDREPDASLVGESPVTTASGTAGTAPSPR